MMPADSHKNIRSVTIHHEHCYIVGFSFLDKEGALIWKIGDIKPWINVKTVLIGENEVIVGVVAKLFKQRGVQYQTLYTDF